MSMISVLLAILTLKSMVLVFSAGSTPNGDIVRYPMRNWGTGAAGTISGGGIVRRDSKVDALRGRQKDSIDFVLGGAGVDMEATAATLFDSDNVDGVDIVVSTQVPLSSHSQTAQADASLRRAAPSTDAPWLQPSPTAPLPANLTESMLAGTFETQINAKPDLAPQEVEETKVPLAPPDAPETPLSEDTPLMPYKVLHSALEQSPEQESVARPPLYGILAALAASLGYALLMVLRCKGFMNELTAKNPPAGFTPSHRATRANGQSRRNTKKATARFCPSRFNSEALQI